jgi:hypothetical protein
VNLTCVRARTHLSPPPAVRFLPHRVFRKANLSGACCRLQSLRSTDQKPPSFRACSRLRNLAPAFGALDRLHPIQSLRNRFSGAFERQKTLLPPFRAFDRLQSFLPPPELRACCLRSLRPPPEPSTSSRAFDLLQSLRPPPEPSTSSRAFDRLQSYLPPPELAAHSRACLPLPPELPAASRASYYLHSLRPPPELPAVSSFVLCCLRSLRPPLQSLRPPLQSLRPPPQLSTASRASCRLHSLQPPPDPSTTSRACRCLQSLSPSSDLATRLQTLPLPPTFTTFIPTRPPSLPTSMPARPPYLHSLQTSAPPYLHDLDTSNTYTPSRAPDLYGSISHIIPSHLQTRGPPDKKWRWRWRCKPHQTSTSRTPFKIKTPPEIFIGLHAIWPRSSLYA